MEERPPLLSAKLEPPPLIVPPVLIAHEVPVVLKLRKARKLPKIPWPVLVIILITVPAILLFGPAAIGVAGAFGAIGLPILLPVFLMALAVVGVITLVRSLLRKPEAVNYLTPIIRQIAADETLRQARNELRKAMAAEPVTPHKQHVAGDRYQRQQRLLTMTPLEFERHIMGFFQEIGFIAWVTKESNDMGVDGFAKHPEGLIVVQCKRYAPENCVGRPAVQQFKGVIEENGAWRGYIVTTSYFSNGASQSADKNEKLHLIDLNHLLEWHEKGLTL